MEYQILFFMRGQTSNKPRRKKFETAEAARAWVMANRRDFISYEIVEYTYLTERQLLERAQLERECMRLGVS